MFILFTFTSSSTLFSSLLISTRDVFDEAGIPHARGVELSHTADELAERIAAFVNNTSGVKRMIVKLNYGI